MRITKNLSTKEGREFWAWHEKDQSLLRLSDIRELPRLGDSWYKAETELSVGLLQDEEQK